MEKATAEYEELQARIDILQAMKQKMAAERDLQDEENERLAKGKVISYQSQVQSKKKTYPTADEDPIDEDEEFFEIDPESNEEYKDEEHRRQARKKVS